MHAARNLLGHCKHQHRGMVAALIRTIFAQPDADTARAQLHLVVDQLEPTEPKVARLLQEMADDLLADANFPPVHWSKIWSNNPISVNRPEHQALVEVAAVQGGAGAHSPASAEVGTDDGAVGGPGGWLVAA